VEEEEKFAGDWRIGEVGRFSVESSEFAAAASAHGCTVRHCAVCPLVFGFEVTGDESREKSRDVRRAGIAIALDLGVSLVCSGRGISLLLGGKMWPPALLSDQLSARSQA
jgi:hypothetical protein